MKISSVEEVNKQPEFKDALLNLLYQLADDDFIISHRGSEWLGLCPHIEEDVAYSSITQNTMGHAAMYYTLLEELGEGTADALAHGRQAEERKNAVLLEEVNGEGHWLYQDPNYDWAYAVVRNYFYDVAKKIRLDSLKNSSYEPLAQVAAKVDTEAYYHLMHWRTWFTQLVNAGGEARERMEAAVQKVWKDMAGVLTLGSKGSQMVGFDLIDSEDVLAEKWMNEMKAVFASLNLNLPGEPGMEKGNGRNGEHTQDLVDAIKETSEVYNLNPAVPW